MRIEIEIPKDFESDYKGDMFKDFFSRVLCDIENGTLCGNYEKETAEMFLKAFDESRIAFDTEKVIEKFEEKTDFLKDCTKYGNKNAEQQEKSYSTMMMYEVADLVDDLIEIVKQEAEQYEECYKDCEQCEAYDKEKHHCPKFCKVIKETVKEIEENHNGWIPCSERLPEECVRVLLQDFGGYITLEKCERKNRIKGFTDRNWWSSANNYLAWQLLPEPYNPKGE